MERFFVKTKIIGFGVVCSITFGVSLFGMVKTEQLKLETVDQKIISTLPQIPVLVKVQIDDQGTITKILEPQLLKPEDMCKMLLDAGIIEAYNNKEIDGQQEEISVAHSLRLFLDGTCDIAKGTAYLLLIGGQWLSPYVVDAANAVEPSVRCFLQAIKDYVVTIPTHVSAMFGSSVKSIMQRLKRDQQIAIEA
jgi:hypothetical protein